MATICRVLIANRTQKYEKETHGALLAEALEPIGDPARVRQRVEVLTSVAAVAGLAVVRGHTVLREGLVLPRHGESSKGAHTCLRDKTNQLVRDRLLFTVMTSSIVQVTTLFVMQYDATS